MAISKTRTLSTPLEIAAIGSPARGEVVNALGDLRKATASELSETLGRSRTGLYHHLRVLQEAGIVRVVETRTRRRPEAVYALTATRIRIGPRARSRAGRTAARKAAETLLRAATRELGRALVSGNHKPSELYAIRAKARLQAAELNLVRKHVNSIERIVRDAKRRPETGGRMFAFTAALTPCGEKRR
jgi:DNA-binding transcriptional ArsR family regulator